MADDIILEARGLTSMPGGGRPSVTVRRSRVHGMLRNPYYVGVISFRGVEYEGTHESLITSELFYRVQQQLDAKRIAEERHRTHHHYLKGALWCGHCDSRMMFTQNKGRGGVYDYFICTGRHERRTDCTVGYVGAERIEDSIVRYYRQIQLEAKRASQLRTMITEILHATAMNARTDVDQLQKRLTKIEQRRRKVLVRRSICSRHLRNSSGGSRSLICATRAPSSLFRNTIR